MAGPLNAFSGSFQFSCTWSAQLAAVTSSLGFTAPSNTGNITNRTAYTLGGNVANGVNELASNYLTIAASGSSTINLQSLTDVMAVTSVSLVRIKEYLFQLSTNAQDPTAQAGTSATSVTIGNAAANPNTLGMGGTGPNMTLLAGDDWGYATPTAAGITVNATTQNVKILNNDSSNTAAVLYIFGGSTT